MFNLFNLKTGGDNRGNALAWVIVIVAILVILFLVFRGGEPAVDESDNGANEEEASQNEDGNTEEKEQAVVTYSESGFSPQEITVSIGETLRFVNNSNGEMWVASAVHPTHEVFSGTSRSEHCPDPENDDFDQCEGVENGASWEFTFDEEGEWAYHNHLRASHFGKVMVE